MAQSVQDEGLVRVIGAGALGLSALVDLGLNLHQHFPSVVPHLEAMRESATDVVDGSQPGYPVPKSGVILISTNVRFWLLADMINAGEKCLLTAEKRA